MADFNYAFIGYDNRATDSASTLTATNVAAGFSVESLGNWQSFDFTQFDDGSCSVVIDCGQSVETDYFAIAGHTLFSTNADDIVFEAANNSGFSLSVVALVTLDLDSAGSVPAYSGTYGGVTLASQQVRGNPVAVFKFAPVARRYYRLRFTAAAACKIGVIAFGERMQFQRGFYTGFNPPSLNEQVDVSNNRSETGQYLGRSIVRSGAASGGIDLERVTRAWIDTVWTPFRRHADLYPFFLSWGLNPLVDATLAHQQSWSPSRTIRRIGKQNFTRSALSMRALYD